MGAAALGMGFILVPGAASARPVPPGLADQSEPSESVEVARPDVDGDPAGASEDDGLTFGWLPVVGLVLLAGGGGAAFGWLARRHDPAPSVPVTTDPAEDEPTENGTTVDGTETSRQRSTLVELCLSVRDQVASSALAAEIDRGLTAAGVQLVNPQGERFDPERFVAVDRLVTAEAGRHDQVAGTEKPGVIDRGRVLRRPEVVVYRHGVGGIS